MTDIPKAAALLLLIVIAMVIEAIKKFRHSEDDGTQINA